jgi:hypothetical protein
MARKVNEDEWEIIRSRHYEPKEQPYDHKQSLSF